jgi:hypothetical protein
MAASSFGANWGNGICGRRQSLPHIAASSSGAVGFASHVRLAALLDQSWAFGRDAPLTTSLSFAYAERSRSAPAAARGPALPSLLIGEPI